MLKKALWVYVGLYVLGMLVSIGFNVVETVNAGGFQLAALILPLVMFAPALVAALELRGKKVPVILTLFCLLIVALPLAGIFNFNEMSLATIGKALIFVPMVLALLYFAYKRLFKK